MKNTKKLVGTLIVMLLTFTMSCKDEFLIEVPLSSLSPEGTFVDAAGLQTALESAVFGIFDQWNREGRNLQFNHNMSDVTVVSKTDDQNALADLRRFMTPLVDNHNSGGQTVRFYEYNYIRLKSCNTVIDYIDEPDWEGGTDDPERNHLLGSAYFLRAMYYTQLTLQYGNIAFPLNVVTTARQDFKVFHMQGIWDQMIEDLEFAVQHMKPISQLPKGQAPNAAARMLLAQVYMLNLRFADAEAQLDIVLSSGEHRLFEASDVPAGATVRIGNNINPYTGENLPGRSNTVPADAINLLHQNEGSQKLTNPEGIWVIANAPFIEGSQGRSARIRAWGPNFGTKSFRPRTPDLKAGIETSQGKKGLMMLKWGRGQGFARPTNYAQYYMWNKNGVVDTQDYRHKFGNWFDMSDLVYDNEDLNGDSPYYRQNAQLWNSDGVLLCEDTIRCWYGFPLYKFYAQNLEDRVDRQDGGKQDIYILRTAHAYLLRAEARFWQDNAAGAAADIQVIRDRANAQYVYTAADVTTDGIGAILDERARELWGEEYRHDELVRISIILAKTGKTCYNGKTYSTGTDIEKSLSENSFYYDRMMEKNDFFREETPWVTFPEIKYTMDPKHIWWPIYEPFIIGNVQNVLNQTTGYDGSENNVEPLTHVVQTAGLPNTDPMVAIGEREE